MQSAQGVGQRAWGKGHGAEGRGHSAESKGRGAKAEVHSVRMIRWSNSKFSANLLNCFDWNRIDEDGRNGEIQDQGFNKLAIEIADELRGFHENLKSGIIC